MQNDSTAIIGDTHGKNDVSDTSAADPEDRKETVDECRRRLDREYRRRARQADENSNVAERRRQVDRDRHRRARQCDYVADPTESTETVGDRCRRLDRERKRRAEECNPSSGRPRRFNLEKRLAPVFVKPDRLCKYCSKLWLYKHETDGMCCGSGKLCSLESQCFNIPDELLPVYDNKYFGPWSRVVNNALRFSSPGNDVPGGMFCPGHPGHLCCCGQTYARVLNGDIGGGSSFLDQ